MDDTAHRLEQLEQQIAAHRANYLRATWAADNNDLSTPERKAAAAAAARAEELVDRLLGQWDDTRTGRTIPT